MKLKDKARDKAERLAARRAENREAKGPQIAWDEAGGVGSVARAEEQQAQNADVAPPSDSSTGNSDR